MQCWALDRRRTLVTGKLPVIACVPSLPCHQTVAAVTGCASGDNVRDRRDAPCRFHWCRSPTICHIDRLSTVSAPSSHGLRAVVTAPPLPPGQPTSAGAPEDRFVRRWPPFCPGRLLSPARGRRPVASQMVASVIIKLSRASRLFVAPCAAAASVEPGDRACDWSRPHTSHLLHFRGPSGAAARRLHLGHGDRGDRAEASGARTGSPPSWMANNDGLWKKSRSRWTPHSDGGSTVDCVARGSAFRGR